MSSNYYSCLICGLQPPTNNVIQTVLFQRELSHAPIMVKIFVGNLPDGDVITSDVLRPLFEKHGLVTECEVLKNYG